MVLTSPVPRPADSSAFSLLMVAQAAANASLLSYVFPTPSELSKFPADARVHWVPYTKGCELANDCYCFHVAGDMSHKHNPEGWKRCAKKFDIETCQDDHSCSCLRGDECLFSDMRPVKILSAIAAARAAGVTHIVEEGRFGGLSAYMYALHGFDVTSIEFLPLESVSNALRKMAPRVKLLTGDGSQLVPEVLNGLAPDERERTMVIFDGEKRFRAWSTWEKVRDKAAMAIFDDSNIGKEGKQFKQMLTAKKEVWWETSDKLLWSQLVQRQKPGQIRLSSMRNRMSRESAALSQLNPLGRLKNSGNKFQGSINLLDHFHFVIVAGDAWKKEKP